MSAPVWTTIVAVLATLVGLFAALVFEGVCFAGMPNSSPAQMRTIQRIMLAMAAVTVACVVAAVVLLVRGVPWWAAGVGAAPAAIAVAAFVALIVFEV